MEIILDEKLSKRKKGFFPADMNINSSEITKERLDNYNKIRKDKVNKALFNKKVNNKEENTNNNLAENLDVNDLIISDLNIKNELKNENYINYLLNDDNIDNIMEFININANIDYIEYGLYLLNKKINLKGDINFLNKFNLEELFFSLLNYTKNQSTKLNFNPIILKLIYNLFINYAKIANNLDISFLCNEQFFNLHLYFLDYISDFSISKDILEIIKEIALTNNEKKLICKIFEYNEKTFFNKLIEMINDNQNIYEICEIILQLFICYINIFNNFNKTNSKKSIEIEMKDNTIYYNNQIIENIYNISIILLLNKHFDKSLYLISNIIKIIYKSKNIEIFDNIMINKNNILMLEYILEKDYSDCQNNIIYTADIFKYLIKFGWNNNNKIEEIIHEVDNYFNKNNNILKAFIHLLLNQNLKLKEKIILKLINVIFIIIKKEIYINNISEEEKYNIYKIILEYIKSSNYKIRKKTMKIIEKLIIVKKDYIQADYFVKKKILFLIKQAIDPSITYCSDEKIILMALNIIDNLLSLGDSIKALNGINTVLVEFENIGGKEMLDNLLSNRSELVFIYSSHLIDKYFN